jgi:hypothetical protein
MKQKRNELQEIKEKLKLKQILNSIETKELFVKVTLGLLSELKYSPCE